MRAFVVVSSLLAICTAEAGIGYAGLGYGGLGYAGLGGYAAAAPYAVAAPYAAAPYAAAAPVVAAHTVAAPVPAAVPTVSSSQYNSADEAGNIAYGYSNINSAKQESGNAYGGVTGSYSYVDEAGVHTINYVADELGFRASVGGRHRRSAPAAIPSVLTTIKLNPGHAVFYRVDPEIPY